MLGASWNIRLFGGLIAERDGHPLVRFQTRKTGGLLAYLAYHMPAGQARDILVEQFWPSLDLDGGRACLATSLSSLRRQLEPPDVSAASVIIATRLDVRLNPDTVSTDVQELRFLADASLDDSDDEAAIRAGARAISLYRGDLLPGYWEDWVQGERERLAAMFVRLVSRSVQALNRKGDAERALEHALAAASAAPDQEATHSEVIRLYRQLGRDLEAVRQYKVLEERMRDTWGHPPSAATRSLLDGLGVDRLSQRRLQRRASRRTTKTAPVSSDVFPQAVVQASAQVAALVSPSLPPLPKPITQFFGREDEIAWLKGALGSAEMRETVPSPPVSARLVTLTGPAGAGKTRLALEAARELTGDFTRNVAFVQLSHLTDAAQLDDALLSCLGVASGNGLVKRNQLVSALAGTRCLLVLDNAEHLGEAFSQTVESLVPALPEVSFLITSRQPLGVHGERIYPLSPLPTPAQPGTCERLLEYACVRMFVDRAQAASPDFQITPRNAPAIAAVCDRLEGIPLAIELAAARVSALTPAQMLQELDERFRFLISKSRTVEDRHRTLEAAIQWSFELLPPATQRFFSLLSLFRGGWTLGGARALWPRTEEEDALDHLERLIEQALIAADDLAGAKRFRILESVREFAQLKLEAADHEVSSERLTQYLVALAEDEAPRLRGPESAEAVVRLQPELANFRTALKARSRHKDSLRLSAALWRLWSASGQAEEGEIWLSAALEAYPDAPAPVRTAALTGRSVLLRHLRRYEEAYAHACAATDLSRAEGDIAGLADALNVKAVLADERGDSAEARRLLGESLDLRRQLEDNWSIAGGLNNLGRIAQREGDLVEARRCYEESQALYRLLGDWPMAAIALANLGVTSDELGDYSKARVAYEESLMICREHGLRSEVRVLLYNLGEAMLRECNHPEAPRYLCESIREMLAQGDRAAVAMPLGAMGSVAAQSGDYVRAARLYGAAEAVTEKYGSVLNSNGQQTYARELEQIRNAMSPYDFDSAWAFGRRLTLEQAVAYAQDYVVQDAACEVSEVGSRTQSTNNRQPVIRNAALVGVACA